MDMRLSLFLLPLLLFSIMVSAQPEEHKGYFGVSAGISIPVADYASEDVEDSNAGYAKSGFNGFISANLNIKDFVGFAGLIGYSRHPYNEKAYQDFYSQQHPDQQYKFSAGPYGMLNVLAGAFVSIPQGNLDVNLKGYIGFSVATMPGTHSDLTGNPQVVLETIEKNSTGLTYGGGVNLMFYTNKNFAILVDAIYLQAEPEFNAVEVRVYENGQLTMLTGLDFKQKFQMVNLAVGIAFTF